MNYNRSVEDFKQLMEMMFKSWVLRGDACIGLCYEALGGSGKMTKANLEKARARRKDAAISE